MGKYDDVKETLLADDGLGIRELARKYQVPVSTVRNWLQQKEAAQAYNPDANEAKLAKDLLSKAAGILEEISSLGAKDQQAAATAIEKLVNQALSLMGKPTQRSVFQHEGLTEEDLDNFFDDYIGDEASIADTAFTGSEAEAGEETLE